MRKLTRIEIDDNKFELRYDERCVFVVEREHLKDNKRGHWLCKLNSLVGPLIVMRDQYRNDIVERAQMHVDGTRPLNERGWRVRKNCSKSEFLWGWTEWVEQLEFQFGGKWTAEYLEWEGQALLTQQVA